MMLDYVYMKTQVGIMAPTRLFFSVFFFLWAINSITSRSNLFRVLFDTSFMTPEGKHGPTTDVSTCKRLVRVGIF
jgi:hypothetical protein